MKKAILILGVNGSGKSTFYKDNLKEDFVKNDITYINADEIKQQLVKDGIESNQAKIKSGHLATSNIIKCIRENKSFAFETTFTDDSATGSIAIAKESKKQGYNLEAYFIHSRDVNLNIARVSERFRKGTGHYVPPEVIKDRYDLCVNNVKNYSNIFDKFNYIDNTNLDFKLSNEKILDKDAKSIRDITKNITESIRKPFRLKEKSSQKSKDLER